MVNCVISRLISNRFHSNSRSMTLTTSRLCAASSFFRIYPFTARKLTKVLKSFSLEKEIPFRFALSFSCLYDTLKTSSPSCCRKKCSSLAIRSSCCNILSSCFPASGRYAVISFESARIPSCLMRSTTEITSAFVSASVSAR